MDFQVLSDSQKRAVYDQYGEEGLKAQVPSPGAGSGPTPGFRSSPRTADEKFAEFFPAGARFGGTRNSGGPQIPRGFFGDNLFSAFGGGGRGGGPGATAEESSSPKRPPPIESTLLCTLEDLYKGATKKMKISRDVLDTIGLVFNVFSLFTWDMIIF